MRVPEVRIEFFYSIVQASSTFPVAWTYLADRCNDGLLTPEEHAEYNSYVKFSTFVAILKSKARQLLADSQGGR